MLHGILNGIDTDVWDPTTDPLLAATYSAQHARRRAPPTSAALEARFGLDDRRRRRCSCVVSRLTWQKGMDLLAGAADDLVAPGGKLAVLGSGEPALENGFRGAAARHPGKVGIVIGYDEALSPPDPGRRRRHAGAVALRALRADPALRPALRLRAGGRAASAGWPTR